MSLHTQQSLELLEKLVVDADFRKSFARSESRTSSLPSLAVLKGALDRARETCELPMASTHHSLYQIPPFFRFTRAADAAA